MTDKSRLLNCSVGMEKKFTALLICLSILSLPILLMSPWLMGERIVFIFGIFMTGVCGKFILLSIASCHWPKTTGVITSSEVVAIQRKYTSWKVKVEYAYSVNGVSFIGDLISFKPKPFTNPKSAGKFASKFPLHAKVSVAYDQQSHDIAVLEPGVQFLTLFCFISGLLIVIGMICKISSA